MEFKIHPRKWKNKCILRIWDRVWYDTSLSIQTEQQGQSTLFEGCMLRISKRRWIEKAGISLHGGLWKLSWEIEFWLSVKWTRYSFFTDSFGSWINIFPSRASGKSYFSDNSLCVLPAFPSLILPSMAPYLDCNKSSWLLACSLCWLQSIPQWLSDTSP